MLLNAAVLALLVVNPGFGDRNQDGWKLTKEFRLDLSAGMNGSAGLVWEGTATNGPQQAVQYLDGWEKGVQYEFSAMVKCSDWKGKMAVLWLEWYDDSGKWIDATQATAPRLENSDWTLVKGISKAIPENAVRLRVMPYVPANSAGRVVFDNVTVRRHDRPAVAYVCSDAYRDEGFTGTVRFASAFYPRKEDAGEELKAVFRWTDAEGRSCAKDVEVPDGRGAVMAVAVSDLKLGRSIVSCDLMSGSRLLGTATNVFTRGQKSVPRKVAIDSHGRCLVDGQPFFPLGMYWNVQPDKELVNVYAKSPFNVAMNYKNIGRDDVAMFHSAGVKLLVTVRHHYLGNGHMMKSGLDTIEKIHSDLDKRMDIFVGSPALLGWYVNDEAPTSEIPSRKVLYDHVRERDPEHPAWCVLDRTHDLREFQLTYDVLGMDPYPVGRHPLEHVTKMVRAAKAETFGARPMWNVPQAFDWGDCGGSESCFPSYAQLRNIAWQHIANGANGLVSFVFDRRLLERDGGCCWRDVCRVGEEILEAVPVLLSADETPVVKRTEPDLLAFRLWSYRGDLYAAAVNPTERPMSASVELEVGKTWECNLAPAEVVFGKIFDKGTRQWQNQH